MSMGFTEGMFVGMERARAAKARGERGKVFDWNTAARLLKERQPTHASAGLEGDWDYTNGPIWRDGKPVPRDETYTYLASSWATPVLDMDGDEVDCYISEDEAKPLGWDAKTYWPESALAILRQP